MKEQSAILWEHRKRNGNRTFMPRYFIRGLALSFVVSAVAGGQTAFSQTNSSKATPAKPTAQSKVLSSKPSVQPIGLKEGLQTVLAAWHSPAAGEDYPLKGLVDTFGPATKHTSSSTFDYPENTDLNPWETIRSFWYFQNSNYYVVLVSMQAHNTYNGRRNPPEYIVRIYPLRGKREYDFTVKDFEAGVRAAITERDAQNPGPKLLTGDGNPWQKYLIYGKGIGATSELGANAFDGSYEVGTVAQVDSTAWNNRDRDGLICCSITSPAWKLGSKKVLNSKEGKYDEVPDSSLWEYAATDKFLDQVKVSSVTICYPASAVNFQSVGKPTDLTTLKTDKCPWTDADIAADIRKSWKMGFNRDCDVMGVFNISHSSYDPDTQSFPITVSVQWSGLFTKNQIDRVSSSIKLIDGAWQLDSNYQSAR